MGSTGTFGPTTNESWRTAFLNSPGSPGSNYSYTTPVIPAGTYTVRVRGVDNHGFITNPPLDRDGHGHAAAEQPAGAKLHGDV